MFERKILYLNITGFSIAIERVLEKKLQGRPVAISPLKSDRAILWEASDEAKAFGVKKGMALAEAKKRCRDLEVRSPRPDLYKRVAQKIEEKVVARKTPLYEMESWGHMYLDMTGLEGLYGDTENVAYALQREIGEKFQLIPSFGGGRNKLVSKVAAKTVAQTREIQFVPGGEEREFFGPLPISVLPLVQKLSHKKSRLGDTPFDDLNIRTNGDISQLCPYALEIAFGKFGHQVRQMALGVDHLPVLPTNRGEAVFEETYLEEDTNDFISLRKTLHQLIEKGTYKLRKKSALARKVKLALRYSDYKLVTKEKELKVESSDSSDFIPSILEAFHQVYTRRTRVQFLGLEFFGLTRSEIQLNLFQYEEKAKRGSLTQVMDRIKDRFGGQTISFGRELIG